ncbi:MAG: replication-associated recombination protein A [Patescibacteria group bacterium]
MEDLFSASAQKRRSASAPLADRMRPQTLEDLVGQATLVGPGQPLRLLIERDEVPSMIFWGPPGSGKTTLAKVIATLTKAEFIELSAVMSGVAEIRSVVKEAEAREKYHERRTILFIDEIHRFNKAQQDALLPHVERGTITCIGATTENPSFEVIQALLSRCKVFTISRIDEAGMLTVLRRALEDPVRGLGGKKISAPDAVLREIVTWADGDARQALNALDMAVKSSPEAADGTRMLTVEHLRDALQRSHVFYDKNGEEHYNIISALHKSMRGSDANAALYWLGRMLEGGEDPLYVARRLVRFASEDIGVADPQALVQAMTAYQACHALGMPECNVVLAQAVVYLSQAPKSNALYVAYGAVQADIHDQPNDPVPLHIRNAPTKLMKDLKYGEGYVYPPSAKGPVTQSYLPERLKKRVYWKK